MYSHIFQCMFVCVCVCSCGRVKGGESRGGPLWVFVWLRLSSSLGKWKLNTPLQRSGYQVREEEKKREKQSGRAREGELHRCGERNRKGEAREKKTMRFWAWELATERGRESSRDERRDRKKQPERE